MNRGRDVISTLRLRFRKHRMLLLEVLLFATALLAISAYQSRNLLETDRQLAPALLATTLAGDRFELSQLAGKPVLIYFFAPWCPYCAASADNIVRLRRIRDEENLTILMVALDWQDRDEINEYAKSHELRVIAWDMGYSTQLGLLWRSWIVK